MVNIEFFTGILFPPLLEGLIMTLQLVFWSIPIGLLVGIILAIGKVYGNVFVSLFSKIYIIFFRGTPLLIQLFILYYGFPSIGIYLSPFVASVIGFVLCSSAYHAEYIRGAIQSVKSGQILAAQALGMSKMSAILNIVLPQALRRSIPGCSNEIIYLIKYSSLAFMVTCIELTGAGKIVASRYFTYTEVFLVIGAVYLMIVSIATKGLGLLEAKLAFPGSGVRK
ncbi:MAG: amino acid ABC transporter permease [Candidatus Atribacteria bacterium]|nr:amino acid ABC transporter permease [Candidatus Atribacteria bacterium]